MHLICLLVVHFNSIKVQLKLFKLIVMDISLKFQFHKGTIKTAYGRSPCVLQRDFNSIKVQLKPFITTPFGSKQYTFQFHKGTIKTFLEVLNFCVVYEFQFHKGTIKTAFYVRSGNSVFDFNSIKVQLKQAKYWNQLQRYSFQFHKGTIKTITEPPLQKMRISIFQFHKGTIKTTPPTALFNAEHISSP